MKNKWIYNISDSEVWTSSFYDTKESCIEDAIEDALERGKARFTIGKSRSVGKLQIDAEDIIDRLKDNMYDLIGEAAETYLENIHQSEQEELEEEINKVFYQWCENHKIGTSESYYTVEAEEEILYCAYCKKVIANEEDATELIEIPGEYTTEEYYFHKNCDYIPCTHLIGASGNNK